MININSVGIHIILCFSLRNAFCFTNYKILHSSCAAVTVTVSHTNEGSEPCSHQNHCKFCQ